MTENHNRPIGAIVAVLLSAGNLPAAVRSTCHTWFGHLAVTMHGASDSGPAEAVGSSLGRGVRPGLRASIRLNPSPPGHPCTYTRNGISYSLCARGSPAVGIALEFGSEFIAPATSSRTGSV